MIRSLLVAAMAFAAEPALACGPDTDCALGERTYRIDVPEHAKGAFVFLHGWRGTGAGIMRNTAMRNALGRQGYALVAPQSIGSQWHLPLRPGGQRGDELPFFDALLDDLEKRHGIARDNVVVGGFSAGGMMAWYLACMRSDAFAGFVPISGTYWGQPPEDCPGGAPNIVHIHGTNDSVVPFAGRPIGDTVQGDVADSMRHMKAKGSYEPVDRFEAGRLDCETQTNADERVLMLCLHEGGHDMPAEFASFGLEQLRRLTTLP